MKVLISQDVLALLGAMTFILGMLFGVAMDTWLDNVDRRPTKCKKKRKKR